VFGAGSGWTTLDLDADLRPQNPERSHWIAVGAHGDRYELRNTAWDTPDWLSGAPAVFNNAFAGKTATAAAYVQDTWAFAQDWKLIPGVRYEHWRASDGRRAQGPVALAYPARSESFWSPKLALERVLSDAWTARLSLARAYRLPTVSELFQGRITGTALIANDPDLNAERSFSKDLTFERAAVGARLRLSLYEDDIREALFSQTNTTVFPTLTNIQNVDRVRARGIEAAADVQELLTEALDVSLSVAHNHAKILENDTNPISVGKYFYRIPGWRADLVGTYHVMPWLSSTLALRYSGRQYNTLDNTDLHPDTFGGTSRYFVADAKVNVTPGDHTRLGIGVENLSDERYFVYHPYPGRTWYAEAQFSF
jgi:iron complex outermembrane receptor protein